MKKGLPGFLKSFHHAGHGVSFALGGRTIKIQSVIAVLVVLASFYFSLSTLEWMVIILVIAAVLAVEMLNTAIEEVCNIIKDLSGIPPMATQQPRDIAAGSSLIVSISAFIIGLLVFGPKILNLFS